MMVYPYLMCWRHFVELQLKSLILLSCKYLRDSIDFPRTHRLDILWRIVPVSAWSASGPGPLP